MLNPTVVFGIESLPPSRFVTHMCLPNPLPRQMPTSFSTANLGTYLMRARTARTFMSGTKDLQVATHTLTQVCSMQTRLGRGAGANLETTPQTTHSHPFPSLSYLSQPLLLIPPLPIHHPYKPRQDRESYEAKKKRQKAAIADEPTRPYHCHIRSSFSLKVKLSAILQGVCIRHLLEPQSATRHLDGGDRARGM